MTRETVAAKSARYLTEARLTITAVDGDTVRATCRGSGELYSLGHSPGRGWYCSCPVRNDHCAHLIALRSVTIRRPFAERMASRIRRPSP
jgi:hypothetical protein